MHFLLVNNSNLAELAPILRRFRYIAGFLLKKQQPHPNSNRIMGVSLVVDRRRWGSEERRPCKVIIRVITYDFTR